MGGGLGVQRVDVAEVVGEFADVRQKLAGHFPALTARPEWIERLLQVAVCSLEREQAIAARERRVVVLDKLGLVVE